MSGTETCSRRFLVRGGSKPSFLDSLEQNRVPGGLPGTRLEHVFVPDTLRYLPCVLQHMLVHSLFVPATPPVRYACAILELHTKCRGMFQVFYGSYRIFCFLIESIHVRTTPLE